MAVSTRKQADIADLYRLPENGKAELVKGELVYMAPTGDEPSSASFNVAASLKQHQRSNPVGRAYPDNVGYVVNLPNRKSFSPDASFFSGARSGMRFLQGAPDFAVEVRSENDYGDAAEEAMRLKRADYFAAGTKVVWDVDLQSDDVIQSYTADNPETPTIFRRGETAHAEPAVPGWTMPVDELFE